MEITQLDALKARLELEEITLEVLKDWSSFSTEINSMIRKQKEKIEQTKKEIKEIEV